MRRSHLRRARFAHRGYPVNSAIWLIGLAVLFYTGHFWPGILILIGISTLLSAVWPERDLPEPPAEEQHPSSSPVILTIPPPSPAPASGEHRFGLLPSNCPRCGAPVRTNEVKWIGSQTAACAYCGSNLPSSASKSI